MATNIPTPSDDKFFSSDMLRSMTHPEMRMKINQQLFPLKRETIDTMYQYLETVNTLMKNGGVQEISPHELSLIQAFIRGNNNPDEIIRIEVEYSRNMIIWLYLYLEVTHKDDTILEYQDFLTGSPYDSDALEPESQARILNTLETRLKTLDEVTALLDKISK